MSEVTKEQIYEWSAGLLGKLMDYDENEYRMEARVIIDMLGTYYTKSGLSLILREMYHVLEIERYAPRYKSFVGGSSRCEDEDLKQQCEKFHDIFMEILCDIPEDED
jgi:hypothetical protein